MGLDSLESLLVENMQHKFFTKLFYKTLCSLRLDSSDKVKGMWDSDLGNTIEPEIENNNLYSKPSGPTQPWRGIFSNCTQSLLTQT